MAVADAAVGLAELGDGLAAHVDAIGRDNEKR